MPAYDCTREEGERMSKLKSKLARRIMAIVLSGAMVMSNMSAYAAELAPKETIETEETVEINESDDTAVGGDADTTDSSTDTVDDATDATDGGMKDTPQSEQVDTSEEDNKGEGDEGTTTNVSVGKPSLSVGEEKDTDNKITGYKLTWGAVKVSVNGTEVSDDSYEVKYTVKAAYTDGDNGEKELSGLDEATSTDDGYSLTIGKDKLTSGTTYKFSVTAKATEKSPAEGATAKTVSATSDVVEKTYTADTSGDTLEAPKNVTAEIKSAENSVVVSWDTVEGATSYEVTAKGQEGAADVTFSGQTATSEGKVTATFSIGGEENALTCGKSYKFSVVAKKDDGTSSEAAVTDTALAIPNETENPPAPSEGETKTYVLTGADLGLVSSPAVRTDRAGTDGYFKISYNSGSSVDGNTKAHTWEKDYSGTVSETNGVGEAYTLPASTENAPTYRIRMNTWQNAKANERTIGFTTTAKSTEVRVWWGAGDANRCVKLVDSDKNDIGGLTSTQNVVKNSLYYNSRTLTNSTADTSNTYYIINQGGNNYLYKVEVIETTEKETTRTTWSEGASPSVSMAMKNGEDGTPSKDIVTINVSDISLSDDGADKLVVELFKEGTDEPVDTKVIREQGITSYSYDYQITDSGSYKAKATLTRTIAGDYDDTNKTATNKDDTANQKTNESESVTVSLSANAPETFTAQQVTNKYEVKLDWDIVNGGDGYQITVSEKDAAEVLATYSIDDKTTVTYTATGYGENNATSFAAGKTYTFTIKSTSGESLSEDSKTADVTIEEVVIGDTVDYILDATGWAAETKANGATQKEDIFTISYGDKGKIVDTTESITATEWTPVNASSVSEQFKPSALTGLKGINFNGSYKAGTDKKLTSRYIEFETSGTAEVKVFWALSGDATAEKPRGLALFKDKDTSTEIEKITLPDGKKAAAYYSEFSLGEKGTYELTTVESVHIFKIIVTMEKAEPEGPTDWEAIEKPTVKAEYDDASRTGKIAVTVNAQISDSTDKVTVHMYDMAGNEVGKAQEDDTKGNEHKFTFSPTYTSRYQFDAVLSRTVEGEAIKEKKSEKTPALTFTLPLKAPTIIDYVNLGEVEGSDPKSGSVEIAWNTVDEADGYILTAVELDGEGNEVVNAEGKPVEAFHSGKITSTSLTIKEGLVIGKTYRFGVTAFRNYTGANGETEESAKGTHDLAINEKADSFEKGKYILDAGMLYAMSPRPAANSVIKTGKYSADQGAPDIQPQTYVKVNGMNVDGDGNEVSSDVLDAAVTATLDLLKDFGDSTYFTLMIGSGGQVNTDNRKIYPNNFVTSSRLELGSNGIAEGSAPTSTAIKFKTSAASRVDVYWRTNTAGNGIQIVDAKGKQIGSKTSDTTNDTTNAGLLMTSFFMDDAGTYYLGQVKGKVRITRVVVYDGYEKKERPQWTTEPVEGKENVKAPEITSAVQEGGKITVKVTADIGMEASADSVTVYMTYKDAEGKEQTASYAASVMEGKEHTFEFTPESSNTYYFSAKMARDGEETTIDSVDTDAEGKDIRKSVEFKLPLGNVAIKSVTDKGTVEGTNYGKIEAVWTKVAEAVYKVVIKDNAGTIIYDKIAKTNLVTIGEKEENGGWAQGVEGLAVGSKYTLEVTAVRAKAVGEDGKEPEYGEGDEWSATAALEFEVSGKNKETWNYANFGSRANRGLISKADKVPAGCSDDSLIDTDPDSETKGQKLADINTTAKDMKRNDYKVLKTDENGNPTKVRVWSLGTYGKIVPNSTDGVSFYYTTVDPSTYNFTLSADMHVDQWTLSNGQEGFGLAVFDQVGASPSDSSDDASYEGGDVWNNSYMAIVSKTEYKWDDENKKVSNTGSAVSLKLGIESIARTGVTAENISEFKNNATVADATKKYFKTASKPLDTQMHDKSFDNLIGNMTNPGDAASIENPITDLRLEIALNDTGYFVSYTPITVNQETREVTEVGTKVTNKYYDRNALSKIDTGSIYAGFFASRNAMVTFSNIEFNQTAYDAENAHPEEKEVEYVKPNYSIVSAATSNSDEYLLTYEANWHGKLYVKDENGADISDKAVSINKRKQDASGNYYIQIDGTPEETDKAELQVTLNTGNNTFQTTFEPDENYDPYDGDPLTRLEDYTAKTELITVTYKKYGQEGQALYVAPLGKATGDGTKNNPLDIYTAVRYVQSGQTIYLMGENYDLSKTIRIERGANGTKDKMIHMFPDPAEGKRPVFDFQEVSAGNGNGFKMGGSSLSGYHTLKGSLAFYNKAKGFDSNSCPDIQVYNSITFNNESYNIAFYTKGSTTDYAARGVISYRTGKPEDLRNKNWEDRIGELTGTAPNKVSNITTTQPKGMSKVFNNTNYFFNRYSGVTENATDFVQHYTTRGNEEDLTCNHDGIVKDTWFGSVAFDGENGWFTNLQNKSIAEGKPYVVERNANGTINVGNFLQLTAEAGITGSGLPNLADSNTNDVVSKNPTDFDGVEETDGTIQKGDADDETDSNIDADDLNKKPGSSKDQVGLWFSIVNEDEIGYTGKALKPEIRVYYDNTLLTKKDYTVTYKNTLNAWLGDTDKGTPAAGSEYESDTKKIPTIIVKGKGNYIGQAKDIYFEIKPVDLGNDDQNRVSAPTITLLKANQAAKPVITFMGKKLSDSKDFTADATLQKEENGKEYMKVTGKGNFAGTIMIEVRDGSTAPKENLASSFKVDKIEPQYRKGYVTDYTGKIIKYLPVEPLTAANVKTKTGGELKLYNPETKEGDITIEYVNNIEIGTATAIIN